MEATLTPARRLDALDAEKFGEMVKSEPFGRFMARVQDALERYQQTCTRSDSELEIRRAQGAYEALRMVMGLPEVMYGEAKGAPRYQHPIPRLASNSRA